MLIKWIIQVNSFFSFIVLCAEGNMHSQTHLSHLFLNCHRFNQVSFYPDNWKQRVKIKRPVGSWGGSGEQNINSFHFKVSCEAFPLYFSPISRGLREGVLEPVCSTIWSSRALFKGSTWGEIQIVLFLDHLCLKWKQKFQKI